MKVTAILKDLTDVFYTGNGGSIAGFLNKTDKEKFEFLTKGAHARDLGIKVKIGNDSFRDKVELNQIIRKDYAIEFKIEPRKGYKLVTFEVR
jgi:hypothetical protein